MRIIDHELKLYAQLTNPSHMTCTTGEFERLLLERGYTRVSIDQLPRVMAFAERLKELQMCKRRGS